MARPNTKAEFKAYLNRKLGGDFHSIEISDAQYDDLIDDALRFCHEYVIDFTKDVAIRVETELNKFDYELDEDIYAVMEVLDRSVWSQIWSKFPTPQQSPDVINFIIELSNVQGSKLVDYDIHMQNLQMFTKMFTVDVDFQYTFHDNTLHLYKDPGEGFIVIIANKLIGYGSESSTSGKIWDNNFLKEYATALAKIQYGQNLGKFDNASLPGGITINYERFISEGKEEKDKLEDYARENLGDPLWGSIHMG